MIVISDVVMVSYAVALAPLVFAALVLKAGIGDIATMQIGNGLVLTLLVAYGIFALLAGIAPFEVATSIGAAAAVLLFGMIFFALGWIGGGDAKLAAVVTLWLGAAHTLTFLAYMAFAGGVLAFAILLLRRVELPASWEEQTWLARLRAPQTGLPYGAAIAAGALLALKDTSWAVGPGV